nr:hypothetical protein Iba_chr08bCG2560 [Ipomoea batatas]
MRSDFSFDQANTVVVVFLLPRSVLAPVAAAPPINIGSCGRNLRDDGGSKVVGATDLTCSPPEFVMFPEIVMDPGILLRTEGVA